MDRGIFSAIKFIRSFRGFLVLVLSGFPGKTFDFLIRGNENKITVLLKHTWNRSSNPNHENHLKCNFMRAPRLRAFPRHGGAVLSLQICI